MGWHTDKDKDTLYAETGSLVRAGCAGIGFFKNPGSVEIPDLTSIPEIRDEPVFDGYRKGGCRSGGGEAPKNVMKNDDFYRAEKS